MCDVQRINFHNLETAALKRYRRFYKLPDVGPNSSKDQLVMAVGRHFMAQVYPRAGIIVCLSQVQCVKGAPLSNIAMVCRLWMKARSLPCLWQQQGGLLWSRGKISRSCVWHA